MADESKGHGSDAMVAQFVFVFVARGIFRENSIEVDVKTLNIIVKTNREQFSTVCTLVGYRNEVKVFLKKFCSLTTR